MTGKPEVFFLKVGAMGLEPPFLLQDGTAEQAPERIAEAQDSSPQALKRENIDDLTARLKSCPSQYRFGELRSLDSRVRAVPTRVG